MRTITVVMILIAFVAISWTFVGRASAQIDGRDHFIAVVDNCDPSDPNWATVGGCALQRGTVSLAEFSALLFSPLSGTIPVGHPSWRNQPSYLAVFPFTTLHVQNVGGRGHTFTEVANFGGGFVNQLNGSLMPAPECNPQTAVVLPPGAAQTISGLAPGTHKFQCCIHPWMRAAVEVNTEAPPVPTSRR
jgi:hypothetical protein